MFAILRFAQEEFEDNKRVIKIRQSVKNRQHNGQKKKNKRTNNDLVNQFFKAISTDAIGILTGAIRFIGADDSDSIPMREHWRVTKEAIPYVSHIALLQQSSACVHFSGYYHCF